MAAPLFGFTKTNTGGYSPPYDPALPGTLTSNVIWLDADDSTKITRSGTSLTGLINKGTIAFTMASVGGTTTTNSTTINGRNVITFSAGNLNKISATFAIPACSGGLSFFTVHRKRSALGTPGANYTMFLLPSNTGYLIHQYARFDTWNVSNEIVVAENYGYWTYTSGSSAPNANTLQSDTLYAGSSSATSGYWRYGINNGPVGSLLAMGPNQYWYNVNPTGDYNTGSQTYGMGYSQVEWDMCEYIVYTRLLTTLERVKIESYLAAKWGLYNPYYISTSGTANLVLWLDSADYSTFSLSGTNVLSWTDKVGGKTFTPKVAATYPTRTDSSSGVFFPNGGGNSGSYGLVYNTTWILPTQNFSVFGVYKPTIDSTYNFAFGFTGKTGMFDLPQLDVNIRYGSFYKSSCGLDKNGGIYASFVMASSNGGIGVNTIRLDEIIMGSTTTTTKILTNGVESSYNNAPDNYTSPYTNYDVDRTVLGSDQGAIIDGSLTGNVYEVLIYNKTLTPLERKNIELYLKNKWSIY
jgi:hypothetical protein